MKKFYLCTWLILNRNVLKMSEEQKLNFLDWNLET